MLFYDQATQSSTMTQTYEDCLPSPQFVRQCVCVFLRLYLLRLLHPLAWKSCKGLGIDMEAGGWR